MIPKFYMVYVDGTSGPAKTHDTLESAKVEAERLAIKYLGTKVYLLKHVSTCAIKNPIIWEN